MRLVLVLRRFEVGGLERVLLSHVEILHAAGYDLTVCVLETDRDNALVTELHPAVRLVAAPADKAARIRMMRRLVDGAVVLLHLADGRLHPTLRPGLATARTVVRFCHSDYSHARTPLANLCDRFLSSWSEDAVVAVGGRSTRFLTEDVGVPPAKVTTLVNAVDPAPPTAGPAPWSWARAPYLVALQSLYRHKGHDSLLRGFAHLLPTLPTARLVVIGDGAEAVALVQQARALHISDQVTWLGGVWHRDLVDPVLTGAAAFASMSRYEGVPISILEARRHGLPLLLSDIPGHRDAAGTHADATFVAVDDAEAFARHAARLLVQPRRAGAADHAALRASWDTYREALLDLVDRACTAPPSAVRRRGRARIPSASPVV